MKPSLVVTAFAAQLLAIPAAFALDQNLPAYQQVAGISGQLKSVGSDTVDHEMQLWAKGFERIYPNVKIEIEGNGSSPPPHAKLASVFAAIGQPIRARYAADVFRVIQSVIPRLLF